jgi:hypothetical protein
MRLTRIPFALSLALCASGSTAMTAATPAGAPTGVSGDSSPRNASLTAQGSSLRAGGGFTGVRRVQSRPNTGHPSQKPKGSGG